MKPKEIDLGFRVSEKKIMELDLPLEKIPISEIIQNADICYKSRTSEELAPR